MREYKEFKLHLCIMAQKHRTYGEVWYSSTHF